MVTGPGYDPIQGSQTLEGVTLHPGYVLSRFNVATDISKQVDFVTAHTTANIPDDKESEFIVPLNFKHQLSNIEFKALSGNPTYNIEVAGIRIGRPYVGNCLFNFCNDNGEETYTDGGEWAISNEPLRLPVQYIFDKDDEIVPLGSFTIGGVKQSYNVNSASSIMGNGGNAMVIPTKNGAWRGKQNPKISSDPNNADPWNKDNEYGDMYFSVLVRVTVKKSGTPVYPYGNNDQMNVVAFEREKGTFKILKRVNKGDSPSDINNEVVNFGWVTVPAGVDWERGKKYVYTLDFTDGVGIQDPEDQDPGTPILGSGIKFTMTLDGWTNGTTPTETDVPDKWNPTDGTGGGTDSGDGGGTDAGGEGGGDE